MIKNASKKTIQIEYNGGIKANTCHPTTFCNSKLHTIMSMNGTDIKNANSLISNESLVGNN